MITATDQPADRGLVIEIEQELAAPRERVFGRWTIAEALARWFAPPGYLTTSAEADPRPGGRWRLEFRSDDGAHRYAEHGACRELEPFARLVLTLTQVDGDASNPETLIVVELEEIGDSDSTRTLMRFTQSGYRSGGLRDANAEGWRGCLDALARDLEPSSAG